MENNQDSSSIYSASGATPLAMIEEKEKKKFLKVSLALKIYCIYSERIGDQ